MPVPYEVSQQAYTNPEAILARATADGLHYIRSLSYPSEATVDDLPLGDPNTVEFYEIARKEVTAIIRIGDGVVQIKLQDGFFRARAHSATKEGAKRLLAYASARVPRSELETDEIDVTFWALGPNGPVATSRKVACPQWVDVEDNYTSRTRDALEKLMAADMDPAQGGKLVLWHGQPGTGKTYALRAWGRAWRDMMDIHYIVDPEVFFGEKAMYMVSVLLGEGDEPDKDGKPRWRLIVAEDTGELLTKDAKQTTGQSLSRLLNVCDGLIGQGLRSLVLVSTNEELGVLHDAVTRPGRCLANIGFDPLDGGEVIKWLRAHDAEDLVQERGKMTVATLYAALKGAQPIVTKEEQKVGFAP